MDINLDAILDALVDAAIVAAGFLATSLLAVSTWLAQRRIKYVDGIGSRVDEIEKNYISRDDFQNFTGRVEDMLSKVHDRVDDIYKSMQDRNP